MEHVKDVLAHADDFRSLGVASIVVVCYGTLEGARDWQAKQGLQHLPTLADAEGAFRDGLGFPRSTWNTHRADYGKMVACSLVTAGMRIPKFTKDPLHDTNQMGGTCVLDPDGRIHYFHITKESKDRPTAADVLAALGKTSLKDSAPPAAVTKQSEDCGS